MAEAEQHPQVPEFDIHDRCKKAREFAGLEQDELAERIECSRNTVGNYERGDVTKLKKAVIRRWAMACGVDFGWLWEGADPSEPGGDENGSDVGTPSSRWTTSNAIAA